MSNLSTTITLSTAINTAFNMELQYIKQLDIVAGVGLSISFLFYDHNNEMRFSFNSEDYLLWEYNDTFILSSPYVPDWIADPKHIVLPNLNQDDRWFSIETLYNISKNDIIIYIELIKRVNKLFQENLC